MYYAEKFPGKCSLMCYNLETGEKTAMVEELGINLVLAEFIIQDDVVHFVKDLAVFLTDGVQAYTLIEGRSMGPGSMMTGFFTDGEEMYGIVGEKLWRMSLVEKETDNPFEQPLYRRHTYDVDLLFNAYEYRLYPIGEE